MNDQPMPSPEEVAERAANLIDEYIAENPEKFQRDRFMPPYSDTVTVTHDEMQPYVYAVSKDLAEGVCGNSDNLTDTNAFAYAFGMDEEDVQYILYMANAIDFYREASDQIRMDRINAIAISHLSEHNPMRRGHPLPDEVHDRIKELLGDDLDVNDLADFLNSLPTANTDDIPYDERL